MAITECANDGTYYREWTTNAKPKAVVMLIHGLGEHCGRYDAIATCLNAAGYAVSAMDLPNHGQSDGTKGHIESFTRFQQATLTLYQRIKTAFPDTPVCLLGHSMGGLVAVRFLIDHQDKFKGAILSGPAIESPQAPPAWQVSAITLISRLFPKLGMLKLDANLVSRDPAVIKAYQADPLINDNKLSARLLVAFFKTIEEVKQHAHHVSLPMLIMHGEKDRLTAPSGSQWLHDHVSSKDKTLKFYPELFHEIFNEPEAPDIYTEVVDWLAARFN